VMRLLEVLLQNPSSTVRKAGPLITNDFRGRQRFLALHFQDVGS
jgi:hypothetical protein